MSRPSGEVIMSTNTMTDGELHILHSQGYWCLGYKGVPVQIKTSHWTASGLIHKYPRTGFNNRAHCVRLSERMNAVFDTELFECLELYTDIPEPKTQRNK